MSGYFFCHRLICSRCFRHYQISPTARCPPHIHSTADGISRRCASCCGSSSCHHGSPPTPHTVYTNPGWENCAISSSCGAGQICYPQRKSLFTFRCSYTSNVAQCGSTTHGKFFYKIFCRKYGDLDSATSTVSSDSWSENLVLPPPLNGNAAAWEMSSFNSLQLRKNF